MSVMDASYGCFIFRGMSIWLSVMALLSLLMCVSCVSPSLLSVLGFSVLLMAVVLTEVT